MLTYKNNQFGVRQAFNEQDVPVCEVCEEMYVNVCFEPTCCACWWNDYLEEVNNEKD